MTTDSNTKAWAAWLRGIKDGTNTDPHHHYGGFLVPEVLVIEEPGNMARSRSLPGDDARRTAFYEDRQ